MDASHNPHDHLPSITCRYRPHCRTLSVLLLMVMLIVYPIADAHAQNKSAVRMNNASSLAAFIESQFPQWDSNHDGILDMQEVNRQIENQSVRGLEAAVIVTTFRQLLDSGKSDRTSVTRQELLTSAGDSKFQTAVKGASHKLETLDRHLFLATDPNLLSFHQGRVGDCYLLAAIAAAVHRDPQAIREMIRPEKNDAFEVVFSDGQKIRVPALTDAELLLGARMDDVHGLWLAVLEKAYGIIRGHKKMEKAGQPLDPKENAPEELIGGGRVGPIISLLTGHKTDSAHNPLKDHKKNNTLTDQQFHNLLVQLNKDRLLICTSVPRDGKRPPNIAGGHCYAVLGYDSSRRQLTIFNPWGQKFEPKGEPGHINGYPTTHGTFNVPLEEFRAIFGGIVYETNKPFSNSESGTAHGRGRR
jgi:Calpain family cysteine protease